MPTVAVIGLGLMGSSFALALKEARPDMVIVGADTDPTTLRKALDRGVVASASADASVAGMADVIVIGAPIRAMREIFGQLKGGTEGKVVTDMASTKADVMAWAAAAGIDLVGGHPMCGKETSGIDAADASVFKDAPWMLTRSEPALTELVKAVGANPVVMDAETHDRLVAGVSHAAFLLSVGYVLALSRRADWPEASGLAAGGFRDMSRLAAGDPELYAGVVGTNRANLLEQLDAISAELARLRRHLEADDPRLVELFEEARAVRERWTKKPGARTAHPQ
jgi:prephenate dehydrogenase